MDERVSEIEIASREVTGNTGRKLDKLGNIQNSIKTRKLLVTLLEVASSHGRNFFSKKKMLGNASKKKMAHRNKNKHSNTFYSLSFIFFHYSFFLLLFFLLLIKGYWKCLIKTFKNWLICSRRLLPTFSNLSMISWKNGFSFCILGEVWNMIERTNFANTMKPPNSGHPK